MESTIGPRPRILYAGARTGQDFNTLKDCGDLRAGSDPSELEQAEVLWVDCATTPPGPHHALLKAALDRGKPLVLHHMDDSTQELLSRITGTRLETHGAPLLVRRGPRSDTPSSYTMTVLDQPVIAGSTAPEPTDGLTPHPPPAPSPRGNESRQDWGKLLTEHLARPTLDVGGPGLIPPQGVKFGVRTLHWSYLFYLKNESFPNQNNEPRVQFGEIRLSTSYYVYLENGGPGTSYVLIRVQQATSHCDPLMMDKDFAKGYWLFDSSPRVLSLPFSPLLTTSPDATNGPRIVTQLSIPLHVKYVREGSCTSQYWSATHGPVTRVAEGWGVRNTSDLQQGMAGWQHLHLAPWSAHDDPPAEFADWKLKMYDSTSEPKNRVKRLNTLASSTFTVESVAAWRLVANPAPARTTLTLYEVLGLRFIAFGYFPSTSAKHLQSVINIAANQSPLEFDLGTLTNIPSPCE